MTVWKRSALSLLVAAGLMLGLSATPAGAEAPAPAAAPAAVAQADAQATKLASCFGTTAFGYLHMNDSFYCLGPQWYNTMPVASYAGVCRDLSDPYFQSTGYPAPNGWSNAVSSVNNNDAITYLEFYDAFNCSGPVLFGVHRGTYRDTLNGLANNKASSVKFRCYNITCVP
jgi:hypothetical protein